MKKRLLSALLALALVFVLLPTTALAGETTGKEDYDISINGKGWKFERDNTSDAYIPAYYYHTNEFSADENYRKLYTNDNLMLTKEGNTVTITIRRGTSHDHGNYSPITFTLKKESTKKNDVPCIEMGNGNNLVITGKGTLNITRNESKSYGAALYSNVGDITINGGITVNVSFLNGNDYLNKNTTSNAIHVGNNHNLTVSGSGTNVTATNQGFDSSPATVCVEGGTITVSGGASLSATNTYADNFSGSSVTQHFKSYAISGTESKPCTLIVADEKSSVTAWAYDEKYGKPFGFVTYNITGATVKAGSNAYYATETNIDNINGKEYVKISVPALQRTSDVLIAGENAVVGQWTDIPAATGTGSYSYDADKKELTLKDVNITSGINAIQFMAKGAYTIKLEGENKISNVSNGISLSDDQYITSLNVTITGTGSLDISAKGLAINMKKGDLKFENTGAIKLATGNIGLNNNALSVKGNITITDMSKYSVTGTQQTGGKPLGSEVSLTEASQLKGGTTGYRIITITPAALEKSNVYVAGTNLYKNTAYTIQNGKPVMGGTYPGNYNIYFDATDYVLHVKDAVIEATGNVRSTRGIDGTSDIVFEGDNSITASSYGIYLDFKSSDLKISGTGSLEVKTIAGDPAIATANNYNTSKSIIISGQGFTVTADTSKTTSYAIRSAKDLTIKDGAAVIAKSNEKRAIDIDGNLTVTNGSLKATSTSNNVPTVQVGGNASFTGSTVTITNNSTTQGEQYKDSNAASSALHVNGAVTISGGTVMAEAKAGGNAIRAVGNITVSNDAIVTAKNNSQYFSAITAGSATGGEVNILHNLIVSGENTRITATNAHDNNLTYGGAINAYIKNANEGHYLKVGTDTKAIAPNAKTTVRNNSLTITRGDEVTRTNSPVVIAGTTLLNDTYYTINGSTVAVGTDENNYNAFYDSAKKTLKLNNAKISTTTNNAAIKIGEDAFATYTITVTGTNELQGNYNHCIESYSSFKINGDGTLEMTNGSNTTASVIYCGPDKSLTIGAEVIFKNNSNSGVLLGMVEKDAYSFAEGYNVYASTNVSGSPLEAYDAAKGSTYKYLRVTKENLAPTTPTTYTVTITAGDNMKRESGALTQEVTKGAAITEVKFMAASGHYFPADYVSKMNLPAGLTAEIRENSWYLIISGTPTSDVTINLPAASVRPTITVSMPTPVAGYTPATASDITLTYSDINKSISKNLTISNVVWQSYVSNGDGSITPGNTLSSGDKFEAGKTYFVRITHEYVAGKYDIVPAAGITLDYTESDSTDMMLLFYTTGAPCNHEYTNDWHANGNAHWHECKLCRAHADEVAHTFGDWITDTPATDTTDGSKHRTCSVCQYKENATIPKTGTGEIVPPTPDNPGSIVIIRPAEEEKPAQQPNPSTGANDLVGLAVAAAVAAALGSAALLRKHD